MRLTDNSLGFLINFLLGVAWAIALISFTTTFLSYYSESLLLATSSGFMATLPSIFVILMLEYMITNKAKYEELKAQTALLKALLKKDCS
jgi:hypothetical protein